MAIAVTCSCGKKINAKDELAGKTVRCPACQSPLTIPGGAAQAIQEAPRLDDEPDEAAGKKKKAKAGKSGKKKNNTMLLIGGGVGVLLLSMCCIGGGVAAFLFWPSSAPEKQMIGKWALDQEAMSKQFSDKQGVKIDMKMELTIEFKSDGTVVTNEPGMSKTGKWKQKSVKDNAVRIQILDDARRNTWLDFEVKMIDRNHMRLEMGPGSAKDGLDDLFAMYMKRV